MRNIYCIVAGAMVAGCATSPQEASDKMKGMTRADVLACAGAPLSEASDGATRVMSYRDSTIIGGSSYECTVSVLLNEGRVDRVSYRGARGVCGEMLKGCGRR